MKKIMILGLIGLAGCGATLGTQSSKNELVMDDGVSPVKRVTSTSEGSIAEGHTAFSVGAMAMVGGYNADGQYVQKSGGFQLGPDGRPIMGGYGQPGYGYGAQGYGYGGVGPVGMAPGNVPIVVTTPVMVGAPGPVGMVPGGGYGAGSSFGSSSSLSATVRTESTAIASDPKLEGRVANAERRLERVREYMTRNECEKPANKDSEECKKLLKGGK